MSPTPELSVVVDSPAESIQPVSVGERVRMLMAQAKQEGRAYALDLIVQMETLRDSARQAGDFGEAVPVGVREYAGRLASKLDGDILSLKRLLS